MAWGRSSSGSSEPPKAKAFSDSMAYQIDRGIYSTGLRMLSLFWEDFTHEELMQLFVAPEIREPLVEAYALCAGNNINTQELFVQLPGRSGYLRFTWTHRPGENGFFVPKKWGGDQKHAVTGPRLDAPEELRERYENMVANLERTSREWGLVRYVFTQLNQHGYCNTAPQMRYLWPPLPTLLNYSGLPEQAKALANPSARAGDKAVLHPNAAPFIRETYDTVTRSIMIDDLQKRAMAHKGHPTLDLRDVEFTVQSAHGNDLRINGIV